MKVSKQILIGLFVTIVGGIILFFVQGAFFKKAEENINPEKNISEVTELFLEWYKEQVSLFYPYHIEGYRAELPFVVNDYNDIFTDEMLQKLQREFAEYESYPPSSDYSKLDFHPWHFGGQDKPDLNDFNSGEVTFKYRVLNENVKSRNAESDISWRFGAPRGEPIEKMKNESESVGTHLRFILKNNVWRIRKITND